MNKEKERNKSRKYRDVTLNILKAVALAGAITTVALLPGMAYAFAPFVRKKKETRERIVYNRVNATIWRLKQRGFLKKDSDGKLSLTQKGEELLLQYQFKELKIKKPRRWDGKWRLVAFDVWETRRAIRNLLRQTLESLGFIKLQASLWVHPYDCEEIIGLLRTNLRLSPAIQYMVVELMDRDYWLRKNFELPLEKHYL